MIFLKCKPEHEQFHIRCGRETEVTRLNLKVSLSVSDRSRNQRELLLTAGHLRIKESVTDYSKYDLLQMPLMLPPFTRIYGLRSENRWFIIPNYG